MHMEIAFWLILVTIGYGYVGYPMWMAAAARFRPRPLLPDKWQTPDVDVLLVVHDAEAEIARKIDNLLALDYPHTQLRVNVVCDGCSDATVSIASQHPSPRVRVFAHAARRGKSACIGATLPLLDADIILFTDVRQRIDPGAVLALTAVFADPGVGAASGELVLESDNGYGKGINDYWRYEKMLRRLESRSGSLIGATGALYAARRSAISHVPDGIILDDMWVPLSVAAAGFRIVVVPQAIAFDRAPSDPALEERRKRRTLAGNYQLLHRWPALALPGAHPLALRLWGHKWLRLCTPWLLACVLGINVLLAVGSTLYTTLLALQLSGYATAVLGRLLPRSLALRPIRLATTFLSLNLSAALALVNYLTKRDIHLWSAARGGGGAR